MRGSGKQVLLEILRRLSTQKLDDDQLLPATRQARAGLLLHGSTGEDAFEHMAHLHWGSVEDEWGRKQQGIASKSGVLLSQFVDAIREDPHLESHVRGVLPQLSRVEYSALEHALWVVVSALQMYEELNSVEVDGEDLDVDEWVKGLSDKYDQHFRDRGQEPPA